MFGSFGARLTLYDTGDAGWNISANSPMDDYQYVSIPLSSLLPCFPLALLPYFLFCYQPLIVSSLFFFFFECFSSWTCSSTGGASLGCLSYTSKASGVKTCKPSHHVLLVIGYTPDIGVTSGLSTTLYFGITSSSFILYILFPLPLSAFFPPFLLLICCE